MPELYQDLILGSGAGGKLIAWHLASSGRRTAVVERRWIGGSCPNIACLPSKNEVWSAKVADLLRRGAQFGAGKGDITVDMAKVLKRKREMVEGLVAMHVDFYKASGAELVMGEGRFVAEKTIEVHLNGGGTRVLSGERCFSTWAHTPRFRRCPAWRRPSRSRISNCWKRAGFPSTLSCLAPAMWDSNSPRHIAASAVG